MLAAYLYVALRTGWNITETNHPFNRRMVFLFPPWSREDAAEAVRAAIAEHALTRQFDSSVYVEIHTSKFVETRMYANRKGYTDVGKVEGWKDLEFADEIPGLILRGIPAGLTHTREELHEWTIGGRMRRIPMWKVARLIELRVAEKERRKRIKESSY